jgi:uncharacterized membrane protein YhaH (DUF805 family)
MDEFSLFFSTKGRIDRKTFGWCVLAVYVLGFFSQALLSGNVIARAGVWPFVLVQATLIWAWLALHIKRARDANEGAAGAIGVAIIYSLAVGLLVLVVGLFSGYSAQHPDRPPGTPLSPGDAVMALFLVILIFNMFQMPDFGLFATLLKAMILIACLPPLISFVFSLRTGLRKPVQPDAPLPPAAFPPPPGPTP